MSTALPVRRCGATLNRHDRTIDIAESAADHLLARSRDMSRMFIEMSDALNHGLFAVNRPRNAHNSTPTSIETLAGWFAEVYRGAELRRAA